MRVILKQNVENLGRKGDIVNVNPGYGRNYLIPKKIALEVTPSNMKMIEIEQKALQKAVEKERASFQGVFDKLNETTLVFKRKTGEKDVIFGSVSSSDIKDALQELNIEIDKKKILLDEPIKRLGNYTVAIKIFHEDRAEVKVEVISEEEKERLEEEKVKEETQVEAETSQVEPEEERKDLETQEEEQKDTDQIEEKEDAVVEERGEPETQKDEAEAQQEEKDEKDEISVEKPEEPTEQTMSEEIQEDVAQEKEEIVEEKAEEETPKPEKKKEKKEKKEKKKEKK